MKYTDVHHGGDVVKNGPDRPSHYGQDNNEFIPRNQTEQDFPSLEDSPEPHTGFLAAPDPTPVYLVEAPPADRKIVAWRPETFTVDNTATNTNAARTQIASNDRKRTRLIITNLDAANSVFITADAMNNNQAFAYELGAGKREEFFHNSAMWAFCASTKSAKIAVFSEYEVDDF